MKFLTTNLWVFAILVLNLSSAPLAASDSTPSEKVQPTLSSRHIYMLQQGMDRLWGSYIFMLDWVGEGEGNYRGTIPLPSEMINFVGQEGISEGELEFDQENGLVLNKEGLTQPQLMAVGFEVGASQGKAEITIPLDATMGELVFMISEGEMSLTGPENLKFEASQTFMGKKYDTWTYYHAPTSDQQTLHLKISGIPTGRGIYWLIGIVFLLILIPSAAIAVIYRRA